MTARTDQDLASVHDGAGDLFAEVLRLETKCRALTASVVRLYADCERAEGEKDEMRVALNILRDENEALCALVTAIARGEIVIPMPIEVRH